MQQYVKGNLDNIRHQLKIKAFFALVATVIIFAYASYLVICKHTTSSHQLETVEFRYAVASLVLQVTLLLSYLKSMLELTRAVRLTLDGGHANIGMQALNFGSYLVLTITNIVFVVQWNQKADVILIEMIRQYL